MLIRFVEEKSHKLGYYHEEKAKIELAQKKHHKYSCSSAISTSEGIENKRRLSIDNAWSNKNFLYYLTFRMLQHTSSEVNGYNCYKHLKNKQKRGELVTR